MVMVTFVSGRWEMKRFYRLRGDVQVFEDGSARTPSRPLSRSVSLSSPQLHHPPNLSIKLLRYYTSEHIHQILNYH